MTCEQIFGTLGAVRALHDTSETYSAIGQAIASRRLDAGISQAELAEHIGLTRTSISNIEKGRQKMLVHTLLEIAACLGTPAAELLPAGAPNNANVFSGSPVSEPERDQISAIIHRLRVPLESE